MRNYLFFLCVLFCLGCSENFNSEGLGNPAQDIDIQTPDETDPETDSDTDSAQTPPGALDVCNSPAIKLGFPDWQAGLRVPSDLNSIRGLRRDQRVVEEFINGNYPQYLANLKPIEVISGPIKFVFCVTPDHLSLGSDGAPIRFPLGLTHLKSLLQGIHMTIPTPKMVDLIYQNGHTVLSPDPMTPGPQMDSTAYLVEHSVRINSQLSDTSDLIVGHKKDVVLSQRLVSRPDRIAIYGWHRSLQNPIQPVSTVHNKDYTDYSQGIRLVSKTAFLNGEPINLKAILTNPSLSSLISDEGALPSSLVDQY